MAQQKNEQLDLSVKEDNQELAYLQSQKGSLGTENIGNKDLIIPRLKVVQGLTSDKFGAKEGEFINSILGTNYGQAIEIVPILHWKSHIMFEGMKISCRSLDGKVSIIQSGLSCNECGKYMWHENKKPECNEIYNYLVAEKKELQKAIETKSTIYPLIFTLMRSSTKTGKIMNTSIKLNATKNFPIFSQYFKISTVSKNFKTGNAYIPDAKISNFVSKIEYDYLKTLYQEWSKMRIDSSNVIEEEDFNQKEEEI